MGRMKELFIDQINKEASSPDDTDWSYGMSPIEYDETTGKYLFLIKSIKDNCEYRIWARTYKEAFDLLPMIESF